MERNMKCGIGLCGHCQFGPAFVCREGPVFSLGDDQAAGRAGYFVAAIERGDQERGGPCGTGRGTGARRAVVVMCLGHLRHGQRGAGAEHGRGRDRRREAGTLRAEHGFSPSTGARCASNATHTTRNLERFKSLAKIF